MKWFKVQRKIDELHNNINYYCELEEMKGETKQGETCKN